MEIYKTHNKQSESGFALIMALVISSVVLSIGLSMLSLTLKQVDLTATTRESEIAFQATSAAMECALMTRITNESVLATSSPGTISFDCGNISGSANQSSISSEVTLYGYNQNWQDPSGKDRYIVIDMYIVDATGGQVTFNASAPRNFSRTCSSGVYCTYIFSQGFNRSQNEILNGASFSVQRELTAEF